MQIVTCVKKPIPVRMCGPWDGLAKSYAKLAAFVEGTSGDDYGIRLRQVGGESLLEIWDYLHKSWIIVYLGDYVAEGLQGEHWPINGEIWVKTYDLVGLDDV